MGVWRHVGNRLLLLIPVLWGIATSTFILIHLIPGDVVTILLGISTRPEVAAALRRQFGLD
ncbi:MAG TPA: hypothetical protein VNM16_06040, partial [Bacillota bacterium]|nr:hypothetical protein [Bacillota bacterium]